MKKIVLLVSMLCTFMLTAQQPGAKNDIIVTQDGQLLQAKVVKVTESTVSFNYPGETVINEISAGKLEKIVFASGRTQQFGKAAQNRSQLEQPAIENEPLPEEEIYLGPGSEYTENELTVLPLMYIKNGQHSKKMSNQMTSFVTAFMASNAKPYGISVPEMAATIEKLVSADIGYQKLKEATPDELRDVLGSEFILRATLTDNSAQQQGGLYSDEESSGYKAGISIELELYAAEAEGEKYEVNFSEEVSLKQPTALLEGKWKSSMKYVLQQMLSSKSF